QDGADDGEDRDERGQEIEFIHNRHTLPGYADVAARTDSRKTPCSPNSPGASGAKAGTSRANSARSVGACTKPRRSSRSRNPWPSVRKLRGGCVARWMAWARPAWFTNVRSFSAKVAAGKT